MPDEPIAVNLGDATPRRLLVEWANRQDAWVRELAADTIHSRQEPSEDVLDRVYATFLAEKGLSGLPQPDVPMLVLEAAEATEDDALELTLGAVELLVACRRRGVRTRTWCRPR